MNKDTIYKTILIVCLIAFIILGFWFLKLIKERKTEWNKTVKLASKTV